MRKCSYCGETGHNRATCPQRREDERRKKEQEDKKHKIFRLIRNIILGIVGLIALFYGYLFISAWL